MPWLQQQEQCCRQAGSRLCRADVAAPLLDFSERRLDFAYSYVKGVPAARMSQPLTVRNVSHLPLSFQLRVSAPFGMDRPAWELQPQEAATAAVSFDPAWK